MRARGGIPGPSAWVWVRCELDQRGLTDTRLPNKLANCWQTTLTRRSLLCVLQVSPRGGFSRHSTVPPLEPEIGRR